ncbi:MAG: YeeE/YedE thiosulfate transporter family protein [Alphaproteobacteria bacterium]|nr:YeeE/YedE thiosulfate transporter family protein [Alphaproteobacteria bacterium]
MDFSNFTPGAASIGGLLIGASGLILFALLGRQAGVSSVAGGLLRFDLRDLDWRLAFIGGIVVGPLVVAFVRGSELPFEITFNPWMLVAAGLLVGFGTRLSNGCTSGHGICGVSRFSVRSIVAVVTFVGVGVLVATLARLGGLS